MPDRTILLRAAALLCAAMAAGCVTPIRVEVDSMVHPDATPQHFTHYCVTAAIDDMASRRDAERSIVAELRDRGVTATAWTELFFPAEEYTSEQIETRLGERGVDAVLSLEVKRVWTDEQVVPSTTTTWWDAGPGWGRYHYAGWQTTYVSGGYTVALPRALYESRLVRRGDRSVVWMASFRVAGSSASNWRDLRRSAIDHLLPRLAEDGFLPPAPEEGEPGAS